MNHTVCDRYSLRKNIQIKKILPLVDLKIEEMHSNEHMDVHLIYGYITVLL